MQGNDNSMATKTNIEWTDFNWNFLSGCSRKSAGCENCYAEKMTKRLDAMGQEKYKGLLNEHGRFNGTVKFSEKDLLAPLSWKKPRKVFVNSMSDLFHEKVQDEWLDKAFAVMALTPHITYQILTKRPERMLEYFAQCDAEPFNIATARIMLAIFSVLSRVQNGVKIWERLVAEGYFVEMEPEVFWFKQWPLPNVWLGVSVEDQKTADERIPLLLQTPAAVRWVSAEPLIGPVNLNKFFHPQFKMPNWIVCGGESGPRSRPFDIQWARDIIAQCKAADVPVFYKQGGASSRCEHSSKGGCFDCFPDDLKVRNFPNGIN